MQVSIDTLDIYTKLKNVDIDDKATQVISKIFKDSAQTIINQQKEELSTKQDLIEVKIDIIKWVAEMLSLRLL